MMSAFSLVSVRFSVGADKRNAIEPKKAAWELPSIAVTKLAAAFVLMKRVNFIASQYRSRVMPPILRAER
jgi:hypothetical protein